jgi:hypothetical protein
MGILSSAVRDAGGSVVGITPYAMVAAGGEGEKAHGASFVDVGTLGDKCDREELVSDGTLPTHVQKVAYD